MKIMLLYMHTCTEYDMALVGSIETEIWTNIWRKSIDVTMTSSSILLWNLNTNLPSNIPNFIWSDTTELRSRFRKLAYNYQDNITSWRGKKTGSIQKRETSARQWHTFQCLSFSIIFLCSFNGITEFWWMVRVITLHLLSFFLSFFNAFAID